jgi:hypothetical protein
LGAGERDKVPAKQKVAKCVVFGNSMLRNVGAEHTDMMVEYFPGIKTEQLEERRDLGSPETVIIHVGTNDVRITRNFNFVIGEVYALVATENRKLPKF